MSDSERGPSHGDRVHRRRVLAEARQELSPDRGKRATADFKDDPIRQARNRLSNIESALSPDSETSMAPLDRACLEVERTWLEFRAGMIYENERTAKLQGILNYWKTENPEVFDLLTQENGNRITLLAKIRGEVIPPIKIGGFHTKRR